MRPKILVAEDDPTIAEVVARYLEHDGHEVVCVADGPTALHKALTTILILSCSTSCCRDSTAWKYAGVCARARQRLSSCSQPSARRATASLVWSTAPTTTSPSRSAHVSSLCVCGRSYEEQRGCRVRERQEYFTTGTCGWIVGLGR